MLRELLATFQVAVLRKRTFGGICDERDCLRRLGSGDHHLIVACFLRSIPDTVSCSRFLFTLIVRDSGATWLSWQSHQSLRTLPRRRPPLIFPLRNASFRTGRSLHFGLASTSFN